MFAAQALRLNGYGIPGTMKIFKLNWSSGSGPGRDSGVEYSIHVSDLPLDINEYQLLAIFQSRYPTCRAAKIVTDSLTLLSKGFGFLRFSDEIDQQRAIREMNGLRIGTHLIRCAPAMSRLTTASGVPRDSLSRGSDRAYVPQYAMNLSADEQSRAKK